MVIALATLATRRHCLPEFLWNALSHVPEISMTLFTAAHGSSRHLCSRVSSLSTLAESLIVLETGHGPCLLAVSCWWMVILSLRRRSWQPTLFSRDGLLGYLYIQEILVTVMKNIDSLLLRSSPTSKRFGWLPLYHCRRSTSLAEKLRVVLLQNNILLCGRSELLFNDICYIAALSFGSRVHFIVPALPKHPGWRGGGRTREAVLSIRLVVLHNY